MAGHGGLDGLKRWVVLAFAATLWSTHTPAIAIESDNPTAALPRYFTINEVMARLDGQAVDARSGAESQLAAIAAASTGATRREAQALAAQSEPFGLASFRAPEGPLWVKWRNLEGELAAEADVLAQCRAEPERCWNPAAKKYLALIGQARQLGGRAKIAWLNRAINAAIRYMSDPDQHGLDDRWTPPLATLESGVGDCEDYAIAKYVALRDAGYAAEDLRLVIVRDRLARQDHAVAAVREGGRWIMLDNRHDVLLERKDAWHFTPMFALDREGVKLFAAPYGAPPSAPPQVASGGISNDSAGFALGADERDGLGLRLDAFEPPPLRGGL
ncbi:MAG TPA: transglutaminase-like cysteine peptidase [Xanthobacteraceae bacterium]|nr:transglutaminase-like cysteine peptidase [Xanthobacteraceae bacterium]